MSPPSLKEGPTKIPLITAAALLLFLCFQLYLLFLNRHDMLDLQVYPNTNPTPSVFGQRVLGQTFQARSDNLSKIEIMLGTFGRENDRDVVFELGTPGGPVLGRKVFNASTVRGGLFNTFTFPPQKHSKGKDYYFSLTSPESTNGNSICAWMNREDIYPGGKYFVNERNPGGDLVFRTYSRKPVFAAFRRILQERSGVWASPIFFWAAAALFLAAQLFALMKLLSIFPKVVLPSTRRKPRWR